MTSIKTVTLDRGWSILLKDVGISAEDVLRRARLPLHLAGQEQVRVSVHEYLRIWEALEDEANDPTLAIRLGQAFSPEIFHPEIFAALCSPDLTVAVTRMARYKKLIAPVTMTVQETIEGLSVSKQWNDPTLILPKALSAIELIFLIQIARIGTREQIKPVRVESRFPLEPLDAYEDYFGIAPVQGDAYRVVFCPKDARRPFLTASEAMWSTFEPELQRRLTKLEVNAPLKQRVHSVLLESLPSGGASIDVVARQLGLSARSLQRKLKPEGVSFKEIVSETREKLARHYVTKTTLSYPEISFLIGFEEPSSFFRSFREWTGATPESLRQQSHA